MPQRSYSELNQMTDEHGPDGRVLCRFYGELFPYPPTPEELTCMYELRERVGVKMETQIREHNEAVERDERAATWAKEQARKKDGFETPLENLTPESFETALQDTFEALGYHVRQVTPINQPDFGVDLVLEDTLERPMIRIAIQAKYYTGSVGAQAVQEVFAGKVHHNCDKAVVVTNSNFTPAAVALAKSTRVLLIDGTQLKIIRKNQPNRMFG